MLLRAPTLMLSRFVCPDYFSSMRSLPVPLPYPVCVRLETSRVHQTPFTQLRHPHLFTKWANFIHFVSLDTHPNQKNRRDRTPCLSSRTQHTSPFLHPRSLQHVPPLRLLLPLYELLWQKRMEPNDVEMIMESVELQSVEPKQKLYRLVGEGLGGTFVWPDEYVQNPALSLT